MNHLDLVTIVVFTLIVVVSGLSFSGTGNSMKAFFAGDGVVPWWISGLSLFMSFFSAGTFVVWGAIAYKYGWVAVAIQWTMCLSGIFIGFVVAPKWQKTGVLTGAEFITRRLGYHTQKVYSYLFLCLSVFTTGAFLYPVAKIMQVSTDIPVEITTVILGVLIILYTAVGGIWAVVVTDVLQFVVLTVAVMLVVPLSFREVGGVSSFIQKSPENFFRYFNDEYSIGFLIAFALYNLFYISGNWAYIQRYTSVRTAKDAKKVGWLFGALYFVSPVIWMLPPMIYRIVNPGLQGLDPEGAYLLMCKAVLPVGMLGMILGAMIFATSSSVNTTLNIAAGVFTNDLYRHFFPKSPEKHLMKIARYSTVLFGVLTMIVALLVPVMGGIIEVVLSVGAITGAPLFLPPLWSLFSKRQTGSSVLMVTILSLGINLFMKFLSPLLFNFSLTRAGEMIVGVGIPIILLGYYELKSYFEKVSNTDYERYILEMKTQRAAERDEQHADGVDEAMRGRKVIALGVLAIGILVVLLGIETLRSGGLVLYSGILLLATGILMLPRNRRRNTKRM